MRLKNEISKSSSNLASSSIIDYSFIPDHSLPMNNDTSFVYNDYTTTTNLNDVSRLSDPLHDPNMLSVLMYNNETHHLTNVTQLNVGEDDDDEELRDLLNPPSNKLLTHNELPVKLKNSNSSPLKSKSLSCFHNNNNRSFSAAASSDEDENKKSLNRVSFEIQSSDGESNTSLNVLLNSSCLDSLSPHRISLLNLVQIAKLKINKMCFFSSLSINSLLDKLNNSTTSTKATNSKSKPPIAIKKLDFAQLFFIEYQFPVLAHGRDSTTTTTSATQVMRANAKRAKDEDTVLFEHEADYSVLFNSSSLETWWRSGIVFKIYCRTNQLSSTNSAVPIQVAQARLSLKNALKSKNFKLYKKLAINDHSQQNLTGNKRIGTLHVSIELNSDIREFLTNLKKLEANEINQNRKTQTHRPKRDDSLEIAPQLAPLVSIHRDESAAASFSFPVQIYLSINDGRDFCTTDLKNIYLICRLFWCKEKVKFEPQNKKFNWTLNMSYLLNNTLIENMRHNFMIIEVWEMKRSENQNGSLIGTCKLPLHEFYLRFSDQRSFAKDSTQSIIGVDGWLNVNDIFSGNKSGELNVLLAIGSPDQILDLQKHLFDKAKIKSHSKPTLNKNSTFEEPVKSSFTEHSFTFNVDNIKIHPVRNDNVLLDEADFYIRYNFPSLNTPNDLSQNTSKQYILSTRLNPAHNYRQENRFCTENVQNELHKMFPHNKIMFEIWSKSYFPNLREKLIGKGELSIEKLISLIENVNQDEINFNNRSFIIPLMELSDGTKNTQDKYIGQLFMTIDYKYEVLTSNTIIKANLNQEDNDISDNSNSVCLNIGVLRANGLRSAIKNLITKQNNCQSHNYFTYEDTKIYVKFSTNDILALNKQQKISKTSRMIMCKTSDSSPEFFDYFDLKCPLTSTFDSLTKKTITLAEQLEIGQIIFEIWINLTDPYKNVRFFNDFFILK